MQVGVSVTVLFLAGLLLRSFNELINVDLGFSKDNVRLYTLGPGQTGILDRIRRLPGVRAAALSTCGLLAEIRFGHAREGTPRIPERPHEPVRSYAMAISPGFLETMRIRLIRSGFTGDEAEAIVNESFARTYFPSQDALGKEIERMERMHGESDDRRRDSQFQIPQPSRGFGAGRDGSASGAVARNSRLCASKAIRMSYRPRSEKW